MIYLDLIFNLSLLVALSIVSGFIEKRMPRRTQGGLWLQGLLFGGVAVLGMLRPLNLGPGLIFDGRSIMVSLCALFFGPLAGAVSGAMTIACRFWLGGTGMLTGVLVILSSVGIGLLARFRQKPEARPPTSWTLYLFGIAVHVAMVSLMFTLPDGAGLGVVRRIGLPVMLLYPLATILAGKILSDQVEAERTLATLQEREERYTRLFNSGNDAVYVHPMSGDNSRFVEVNDLACSRLGYSREELLRLSPMDIDAREMDEPRRQAMETLARSGRAVFEMVHVGKSGQEIPVEISSRRFESEGEQFVLSIARDISERNRAEEALRESEAKLRSIMDNVGIGVALIGTQMEVLEVNRRMRDWYPAVDPSQRPVCYRVFSDPPRDSVCDPCPNAQTLRDGRVHEAIVQALRFGAMRSLRVVSSPIMNSQGEVTASIEIVEDITEQLSLEAQLRQSQKMEAVGRLAGGVAHDFNNMLGVILGHTELALQQVPESQPLHADLQEVHKAAERSADLTRQLLAFARKQTVAPRVLDLNETIEGLLKMIRRLIGEDIDLAWRPGAEACPVRVDPSQIDQILANLCLNARDAIAGVGRVTIETRTALLDAVFAVDHPEAVPGEYVVLAVSDDGCGMDAETASRVFEPFFTTKQMGKGTGLGLATVYGIVQQNDGFISVYSEPGLGTTFRIYLPRHVDKAAGVQKESSPAPVARGHETILLVEDEPAILKLTTLMLERQGYHVLPASRPGEAMRVANEFPGQIHMLITDVVMPEMNGRAMAKNLMALYPGLKRLFMSGYTADVIAHRGVLDEGVHFIQKPFSMIELATKVREVLDGE